jgi:5'-phosphate synthase pdxT subunit
VPRVGVLALQGDVREHERALRAAGAVPVPVRGPDALDDLDGLVLPGGESTTMSRLLGLAGLLAPLRARVADGLPVYGSCAGLVLLAEQVLDGRPDQQGVGGLDGERAQVLARVPDDGTAAAGRVVAVRQGSVLATSFHPELTGDVRVHRLFVDMVKEARG